MMTNKDPRELADALTRRSICAVQVSAVLADTHGVFGWGWNSAGVTGLGEHAEAAAVRRANRKRLAGATIYVAARRRRNGKMVVAAPCLGCQTKLRGVRVVYRDSGGIWRSVK